MCGADICKWSSPRIGRSPKASSKRSYGKKAALGTFRNAFSTSFLVIVVVVVKVFTISSFSSTEATPRQDILTLHKWKIDDFTVVYNAMLPSKHRFYKHIKNKLWYFLSAILTKMKAIFQRRPTMQQWASLRALRRWNYGWNHPTPL